MRRTLFWVKQGFYLTFCLLLGCGVYGLIMIATLDGFPLERIPSLAGICLAGFSSLMGVILVPTTYSQTLQPVLAFGSTRKAAVAGLHICRLLPAVCITGIGLLPMVLFPESPPANHWRFAALSLSAFLFFNTVGMVFSLLKQKYGKAGLFTFFTLLLLIVVGFAMGLSAGFDIDLSEVLLTHSFTLLFIAASPVIYMAVSLWEYCQIIRCNVAL